METFPQCAPVSGWMHLFPGKGKWEIFSGLLVPWGFTRVNCYLGFDSYFIYAIISERIKKSCKVYQLYSI